MGALPEIARAGKFFYWIGFAPGCLRPGRSALAWPALGELRDHKREFGRSPRAYTPLTPRSVLNGSPGVVCLRDGVGGAVSLE